jgi:hypothetical protein
LRRIAPQSPAIVAAPDAGAGAAGVRPVDVHRPVLPGRLSRADEQGRGFVVAASEVRGLAEEAAAAESMAGQARHLQSAVAPFMATGENTSLPARAVIERARAAAKAATPGRVSRPVAPGAT